MYIFLRPLLLFGVGTRCGCWRSRGRRQELVLAIARYAWTESGRLFGVPNDEVVGWAAISLLPSVRGGQTSGCDDFLHHCAMGLLLFWLLCAAPIVLHEQLHIPGAPPGAGGRRQHLVRALLCRWPSSSDREKIVNARHASRCRVRSRSITDWKAGTWTWYAAIILSLRSDVESKGFSIKSTDETWLQEESVCSCSNLPHAHMLQRVVKRPQSTQARHRTPLSRGCISRETAAKQRKIHGLPDSPTMPGDVGTTDSRK